MGFSSQCNKKQTEDAAILNADSEEVNGQVLSMIGLVKTVLIELFRKRTLLLVLYM